MKRFARSLFYLSVGAWLLSLFAPLTSPAYAEIEGNCGATFKSVDVAGLGTSSADDAIDVDGDEVVVVTMTSAAGFASHEVKLEIAGVSRTISNKTDDGDTEWSDTVKVKDYAWMGAGLYKVIGSATLSDGSTCSGAALINVTRFPLTTVAGGLVAAGAAVGLLAVAGSAVSADRDGSRGSARIDDWVVNQLEKQGKADAPPPGDTASSIDDLLWEFFGPFSPCLIMALPGLLLTVGAMAVPGGGGPAPATLRLRRARWLPRVGGAGVLGGLLGGLCVAVLLQQFGVYPLTVALLIEGLVGGLIIGILIPSLVRIRSVMRVNAAIGRAEQRLAQARGTTPPPPPESAAP